MKKFKSLLLSLLILIQFLSVNEHSLVAEPINNSSTTLIAANQSQKVLGVADFTNDTGDSNMEYLKKGLANSLVTSLGASSNGSFSIVERGQLESIIKEMGLANTGVVDISTASKIGNATGATQIIVGGIIKLGATYRLNVRVIEVKTSRVLLAFTEYTQSEGDILKLLDKVADKIVIGLSEPIVPPVVYSTPNPVKAKPEQPVTKIQDMKIPENIEQAEIPLWLWITGGIVIGGVVLFSVLNTSKPRMPTSTSPYPVSPSPSSNARDIGALTPNSVQLQLKF